MRRAIIATAGTAAALVALLSYKSSNALKVSKVAVTPGPAATTTSPTSGSPSSATSSPFPATSSPFPATSSPSTSTSSPSTSSGSPSSGSTSTGSSTTASGPQAFTGTDVQYNYGEVQLRVTTDRGKITKVDVVKESAPDGRSESINAQAIPILLREALAAQGVNIDVVSGATFTSQAFAQALRSALDQAGK